MDIYAVVYIDEGNCEIVDYTIPAYSFVDAMEKANDQYFLEARNVNEIQRISVEVIK